MNPVNSGGAWTAVYLGLVLAPLVVLFVGDPVPPGGFWWDLAIALGFAGLAMMSVQFILTARFKRATAPFGIDVIYYFHRYIAGMAFAIVLAHPAIILTANPDLVFYLNPLEAPWFMTVGVLSIVALTLVIVTSYWRGALGISYGSWRVIHTGLAVAAVLLALLHVQGVGFYIAEPWKRGLWTVITLSWVGVIGWIRIVKPWRLRHRPYTVAEVRQERGDAWTVALEPAGHSGFVFQPGQFVWLTLRHNPFAMREHPFSVSSSPELAPARIELTIKELGDFTRTIGATVMGERAYVDGPYGAFSIDRHPARGYVFLAGGIGIAPIMSMLRALADRGDARPHVLFYAYRRWERLTFREALEALGARLDLRIVYVLEEPPDGWDGEQGRITAALLARHLPDDRAAREYFVCGPEPMIHATERALRDNGVPISRVRSELFNLV